MARPAVPDSKLMPAAAAVHERHRTGPIPETLTQVNGYPKKLKIYRLEASPYWWVRTFHNGKIYRRSTKTDVKRDAMSIARAFFDEVVSGRVLTEPKKKDKATFAKVADAFLKAKKAQVARNALTDLTYRIMEYRLKKAILPALGSRDITTIHYDDLEHLLQDLSHQKLTGTTISSYMKTARSVFVHAYKRRDIPSVPHFPQVDASHEPRGSFTNWEYRKLWSRARSLIGKRFEYRKLRDTDGNEMQGQYFAEGACKEGRLVRKITITRELCELIVFSTNSYTRPTDIKNLKHKHVTIVRGDRTYLRMKPPPTKGHKQPFVTMTQAVEVYERLTQHNRSLGRNTGPEDYVFFPDYENRDYALKQLMRQFAVLMWNLNMGRGPNDEERTMYSLRHTCFMFRLMYGDNIDLMTLAKNGRTSVEMIQNHYASQLTGEDNIDMLQSRRKRQHPAKPRQLIKDEE